MKKKICFILEESGAKHTIDAKAGEKLTQAAYRAGVTIQQSCGGSPSCTDCKIKVLEGGSDAFEKAEGPELRLMGNIFFITQERLACQAIIKENSTVLVPRFKRKKTTTS